MEETGNPGTTGQTQLSESRLHQIMALPVSQKIKLAKIGDRGLRAILLKDSNKEVREAVLASPRITETEVVAIAGWRGLDEELLRKIATNREWLKNYQVRLALANNPKTPLPISLKLIATLRDTDLKELARNSTIAEELVAAAERTTADRGPSKPQVVKDEKRTKSRYQEIQDLPVPEKVKLAMSGDKEARSILIKDSNKQVQDAVLNSPRITEPEIVAVANSRNVGEDILRRIASNREWMKNYQVRLGLANNPKTPLTVGLRIVGTLMVSDLRRLSKSKSVSSVLTGAAGRALIKKGVQS
jgi:hypothetical protein